VSTLQQRRLRVAVIAGGRSSEHVVSLSSGAAVRAGLEQAGHEVAWVEISPDGAWWHEGERLPLAPADGLLGADVAFPVLHGPFGEDGTVQGVLETLDVPYVGSGVRASAVCLDKVLFKQLLAATGAAPQVAFVGVTQAHFQERSSEVLSQVDALGVPVFVKPARLGSSLGIARANTREEVLVALERAFSHDALVIVEALARGIEVECGVLGGRDGAGAFASEPGAGAFARRVRAL
jgi:D-alanine-D-alanine ligase